MGHPTPSSQYIARRTFLLIATASPIALLTACGSGAGSAAGDSADDLLRSQVADAEAALIAQYQATIAAYQDLAAPLTLLMDQHRAHLAAMAIAPSSAPPSTGVPVPGSARQAVTALADAERAATQQRGQACVDAMDPALARTLAFIAASEASHVPALGQVSA
jgi:hypothetical protein